VLGGEVDCAASSSTVLILLRHSRMTSTALAKKACVSSDVIRLRPSSMRRKNASIMTSPRTEGRVAREGIVDGALELPHSTHSVTMRLVH
jgi:hypothetical protein